MEMTDVAQEHAGVMANNREHQAEMDGGNTHSGEEKYPSGVFPVEGFEDFDEFVLDFDDYDLLESIHSHLGSPLEPIREYNINLCNERLWASHCSCT